MSLNLFYYSILNRKLHTICLENNETIDGLYQMIAENEGINGKDFKLYLNGKYLETRDMLRKDSVIRMCVPLTGGKGGFGSMLRAIGAQIEKTTNREACRDLSGRRLRDVNEEKRIKDWIGKQSKRKEESERKRKEKFARLAAQPKCEFNDIEFERNRSEIPDIVEEALQYGLQQQQSTSSGMTGTKRKTDDSLSDIKLTNKKHSVWLGIDEIEDSDDSCEEQNDKPINDETNQCEVTEQELIEKKSIDSEITDGVETSDSQTIDTTVVTNDNESMDNTQQNTIITESSDEQKQIDSTVDKTEELVENQEKVENSNALSEKAIEASDNNNAEPVFEAINLKDFHNIYQLESLGMDQLKHSLIALGLKCGGTLQERAKRLWSVRGLDHKDIPKKLFAKK